MAANNAAATPQFSATARPSLSTPTPGSKGQQSLRPRVSSLCRDVEFGNATESVANQVGRSNAKFARCIQVSAFEFCIRKALDLAKTFAEYSYPPG
jgi:hypothetical protein